MANENDNFKDFIAKNTKQDLQKPVNEFAEIIDKIEHKKSFLGLPHWLLSSLSTACLVLIVFTFYNYSPSHQDISDDEISFLFNNYDDSIYEDESVEFEISLIDEY